MPDLADRVRALERAVTDHDDPLDLPDVARLADDVTALQERVDDLDARLSALAARQQAVEGYVDRVDHVNDAVERRADAALAAVDRLEADKRGARGGGSSPESVRSQPADPAGSGTAGGAAAVPDAAASGDDVGSDEGRRPDSRSTLLGRLADRL